MNDEETYEKTKTALVRLCEALDKARATLKRLNEPMYVATGQEGGRDWHPYWTKRQGTAWYWVCKCVDNQFNPPWIAHCGVCHRNRPFAPRGVCLKTPEKHKPYRELYPPGGFPSDANVEVVTQTNPSPPYRYEPKQLPLTVTVAPTKPATSPFKDAPETVYAPDKGIGDSQKIVITIPLEDEPPKAATGLGVGGPPTQAELDRQADEGGFPMGMHGSENWHDYSDM